MEATQSGPWPSTAPPEGIERYGRSRHYESLCGWWIGHGQEPEPEWALPGDGRPGIGLVIPNVAAGFMYYTGTRIALLHEFVSNPEAPGKLTSPALDALILELERQARFDGIDHLAAWTKHPAIVSRGRRLGWRVSGRDWILGKVLT